MSTATKWDTGDLCSIDGQHIGAAKGVKYDAKILDWTPSTEGGFHLMVTLEITYTALAFGQPVTQTWTHPVPVQSYKLRKPLMED